MSARPWTVAKFGGTSVGSPDRLARALTLISAERQAGPLAVVVSAMGDSTDHLLSAADAAARGDLSEAHRLAREVVQLAKANAQVLLSGEPTPLLAALDDLAAPLFKLLEGVSLVRERSAQSLDAVASFGERLSATVVTALLVERGLPAAYLDSRRWLVTDDRFGAAVVDWPATQAALAREVAKVQGGLFVTTGFIGQTADGRTTTLGRNGSDYTATLLGRGLSAREVDLWTDVPGVMTADPAIVPDAYPLARLSYMEALELASFGARMFHPRTMVPLIEAQLPLRIRDTARPEAEGTRVDATGAGDKQRATSVTSLENLALLDVESRALAQRVRLSGRVLTALDEAAVPVWMATQSAHGQAVAVAVPLAQVERAEGAVRKALALELERGEVDPPRVRAPVTLLTLVAEAMGQAPNVAGRFFHALGTVGVNVHAIAQGASSRSVSCAIDGADTAVAVRTVHAAFHFAREQVSVAVLGTGTVGGNLLAQLAAQQPVLQARHGVQVRLVAVADSRRLRFDERGLAPGEAKALLQGEGASARDDGALLALLDRLRKLPTPVLVDCTAADGMEVVYQAAFERGIHVVAANKKPLTLPTAARAQLMASSFAHHRAYRYETTVGASLPVIETLQDLIRTGDRVRRVEGSFSGTLGYLCNELMAGAKLSAAVAEARAKGYTEPHPRDDLSGLDVARKALILARELGLTLELSDVAVEPLVSAPLLAHDRVEDFLAALEGEDEAMAQRLARAASEGKVLRYLARIEPREDGTALVRVGPMEIPADHPATRLRGSEAFVAFTTERYAEYPLIVQGAGAGGAVTAAGVLADIFKLSQRGRGA